MSTLLHRKWVRAAHRRGLPLPDPLPPIRLGPGPRRDKNGKPLPYTYTETDPAVADYRTIWLLPSDWTHRPTLGHELFHVLDADELTRPDRLAIARIIGHPGLRWFWRDWNPATHWKEPAMEPAADAYGRLFTRGAHTPADRKLLRYLQRSLNGYIAA